MQGIWSHFFLGRRWINNQRKSNSVWYNMPHWKIIALICCARRPPKVTLVTVFVSIVAWKQARWPPLFITFLISPCRVTSTYQVSSEIYGGFFYRATWNWPNGIISINIQTLFRGFQDKRLYWWLSAIIYNYYMATIVRALWLAAERALFCCKWPGIMKFFSAQRLFRVLSKATSAWAKTTKKMDKVKFYFQ